jgi:glycosyltransferase involved in cell wall biosynthesis
MVATLVRQFRAAGCPSLLIVPANGEGWLESQLAGEDIIVEHFQLDHAVSPAFARWLEATLRRHRIALAHSHEFTMAVYGAWAARRAGARHVITMHGSRYYAARWRRRLAMRAAVRWSGAVVAVSRGLATALSSDLSIDASRVSTIANGVQADTIARSSLRAELGLPHDAQLLVSIGNLYAVKGHRVLLDALARLPQRSRVHVAIAGRGDLESSLRTQAEQLGIGKHVHLLGLRSDVQAVLAAADVFVLPSLSEGLPLALLEAMFAGRAIVASDVGEVRTVLADGAAGLLVPPGDTDALGEALDQLLDDAAEIERLGDRARQRAAAEYSASQMIARYAELYTRLLG